MKPRLGIVGAGRWGSTIAERIYREGVAEIAIIYDKDLSRSRALASRVGAIAAEDLRWFERVKNLTGVIVATSIDSLAQVSSYIIGLGLNVLIEKPVADSLEKVRSLRLLAERKGVVAMPGFIVRFDPVSIWMKGYISSSGGGVDELYLLRFSRRPPQARASSILLDLAIHDIDLARYLLSEDLKPVSWHIHSLEEDQGLSMYARHSRGYVYIGVDGVSSQKVRKVVVIHEKGYVEGDYVNQYIIFKPHSGGGYQHVEVRGSEALLNEVRAFIEKCEGKDVEAPTLYDAEKAHEVIDYIMRKQGV